MEFQSLHPTRLDQILDGHASGEAARGHGLMVRFALPTVSIMHPHTITSTSVSAVQVKSHHNEIIIKTGNW